MKYRISAVCLLLALSGCVSPEQQRAKDLAGDRQQCSNYGFAQGSSDFANCMQTAAMHRDAMNQRKAALAQQQSQFDQAQKDKAAAQSQKVDNIAKFDKQGNPNFDANGNYIGPHGVGTLVGPDDNPDNKPGSDDNFPSAKDFPAGSCTNVGGSTKCASHTTSSSNSDCTTINGVTNCNNSATTNGGDDTDDSN
ncbi:MAG: hypothetical protein E5Y31_19065 [Mesorhizobium sp.]|nr:MAG: hypothetical protein E5Y31_19065 [Mesorhizobium sp.]